MAADAATRARLEDELCPKREAEAIVTAEVTGVAELRAAHPRTSIIVVGLPRSLIAVALDAGADAAIAGPPRPDEVRARLRAIARRRQPPLQIGRLEVRPWARQAWLDGAPIDLTRREFDVLWRLAAEPGQVLTKAQLARICWPHTAPDPLGRALERCLARLRRKLGGHAPMLVTVWGVGYRLGEPD